MGSLRLKWGTWKAYDFEGDAEAKALLEEYFEIGSSMAAAMQKDTPRQKEILCKLVELVDDPEGIYLDWDGKYVSKEEAKEYIMNYGKGEARP